ncbi:diguanylate cyclase [Sphingomonas sp.]|uniref:diguanylate cyclase domain-containing protein n=1 Tax=Sphingomonas sp. TaxID=28214 RepID=UPI000DAFECC9|nr:diguanylate cyclase [Sphingomonas sp.]PZU06613.1 MAG: GGDEF domain-containing protein [Sphingomonas sp.]
MVNDSVEAERLATLASLEILDTPPEREFDEIVALARELIGAETALISLVDDHRQWFKAREGLDAAQTPREYAFCAHAIAQEDIFLIPDATRDHRFATNPLVTGGPAIRFYAGMPISAKHPAGEERLPIGTLCVLGPEPRDLATAERRTLRSLARIAEALIDARAAAIGATRLAAQYQAALERLNRSHRLFRQAERMANIGSWRLNLDDDTLIWSEQTYAIHGRSPEDMPSLTDALAHYPLASRAVLDVAVKRTMASGEPFDIESDFITAQGQERRVRSMGELEMRDGEPIALVGVFQDVTERHRMEQALRNIAETDELTRIASRSHFNATIDARIATARETGSPLALLLIDLDHFKEVNDRCGHAAGDDLLRLMAKRLRAPYLETSFAARLGGDEFVMVITSPDVLADLPALLRRMLADLRHTVTRNGLAIRVSATIGAAWLREGIETRGELLQCADEALYDAKEQQRGAAIIAGRDELVHPPRRNQHPRGYQPHGATRPIAPAPADNSARRLR